MLDLGFSSASPVAKTDDAVPETTAVSFEKDVLQPSMTTPVIVQFWAPWCGPCKQLKPVLDAVVAAAGSAVRMVRVNIDTSPDLAQALRVQSVPTVYAFFQAQPVDGFVGMRPESEIKAFLARLTKLSGTDPVGADGSASVDTAARDKILQQADDFFTEGQPEEALAAYSTAYDLDPASARALRGLAWCFLALGEKDAFCALIDDLDDVRRQEKDLKGLLWLRAQTEITADIPQAAEGDLAATFARAKALLASLLLPEGIDALLAIIRREKDWEGGAAREALVALLDALGPEHPLTRPARRQLSSALFS